MDNTKEQLMSDLALLIKGKSRILAFNQLINHKQNEIQKLTLKNIKRKNMLYFLLPSLALIFLAFPIFHSGLLFFIGLILFGVWFFQNKRVKNKTQNLLHSDSYKKAQNEVCETSEGKDMVSSINGGKKEINEVNQTLNASGANNRIPEKYAHLHALQSMFEYLYNQRADTLKEAINLYETEAHQARLENKQQQILSTVSQASVDARAARYASSIAATNSAISAVWAKKASDNSAAARDYAASASRDAAAANRKADQINSKL
ncbi:hypothetical protein FH144_01265 [Staphylococcus caledonicus]|uniref:hypothetical protein n=1 Tax=Staphylococcus sp. acrmy TaxID=2929076 RepID=UPI000D1C99B5|nr:hypothetical protein [Staphylococcus sp. acrmy]MCI2947060.1 hypothetical protein [Staphylococcus sp. acrmy]PTE69320.1 hypothetical protein BUY46_03440 [Staphylococcus devriesei]